jgi:Protein of unknown function (DUF2992)
MRVFNSNQISSTITVMWDGKYWMALFERRDNLGYSVAKATISIGEPQGYQIEKFLNGLDRGKLQFTAPGDEPTTTKTVIVEKKQKFEKTHSIEVTLKNPFGDAKILLNKQKNENKIVRREKENTIKREENKYKQDVKLAKKIEKQKGR